MDASGACTGAVDAMKWVNSAWMSQSRSFMCGYCDRFLAQVWVIKRNVLCAKIWKTRKENSSYDSLCCCVWSFTYTSSAEMHPNDMCWLFFFGWLCNFFFDLSLERWCETKYHRFIIRVRPLFLTSFLRRWRRREILSWTKRAHSRLVGAKSVMMDRSMAQAMMIRQF